MDPHLVRIVGHVRALTLRHFIGIVAGPFDHLTEIVQLGLDIGQTFKIAHVLILLGCRERRCLTIPSCCGSRKPGRWRWLLAERRHKPARRRAGWRRAPRLLSARHWYHLPAPGLLPISSCLQITSAEGKFVKFRRKVAIGRCRRLRESQHHLAKHPADGVAHKSQKHHSLQNGLFIKNSASLRVIPMSLSMRSSSSPRRLRSRTRRRHSRNVVISRFPALLSACRAP